MGQSPYWETDSQLVKKFPTFQRPQGFITKLKRTHNWMLSWVMYIIKEKNLTTTSMVHTLFSPF
jgi:hypothetical protein